MQMIEQKQRRSDQKKKKQELQLKHIELAELRGSWQDADPSLIVHHGVGQTK